jgi:hypothetical protein
LLGGLDNLGADLDGARCITQKAVCVQVEALERRGLGDVIEGACCGKSSADSSAASAVRALPRLVMLVRGLARLPVLVRCVEQVESCG